MNLVYKKDIELESDEIIVYTVRDSSEFSSLLEKGQITADKNIVEKNNEDWGEFLNAYKWMSLQCSNRLKNYNQEYPLWCWENKPSPKNVKVEYSKNSKFYIVKFKIKKQNVLFSSFSAWHFVLNEWFFNEEEEDSLYDIYNDVSFFHNKGDRILQEKLEKSWHEIFNSRMNDLRQGCFDSLKLDQVIEIREYKGNSKKEWAK